MFAPGTPTEFRTVSDQIAGYQGIIFHLEYRAGCA